MLFILRNMFLDFGKVVDKIIKTFFFFKMFLTECHHHQPKTKKKKKNEIKTIFDISSRSSLSRNPAVVTWPRVWGQLQSMTADCWGHSSSVGDVNLFSSIGAVLNPERKNLHDSNDCNSSRHKFSVWKHSVKKCLFLYSSNHIHKTEFREK